VHLDVKGNSWIAIINIRKEALLPMVLLWLVKFVPQNGKLARSLNGTKTDEPMQSRSESICRHGPVAAKAAQAKSVTIGTTFVARTEDSI
jgi:hypothetical protein